MDPGFHPAPSDRSASRRQRTIAAAAAGLFVLGTLLSQAAASPPAAGGAGALLDEALALIGAARSDLGQRADLAPGLAPLERFGNWIQEPHRAPSEAQQDALRLFDVSSSPHLWLRELGRLGDVQAPDPAPPETLPAGSLPADLPEPLRRALEDLLGAALSARQHLLQARDSLSATDLALVEKALGPESCDGPASRSPEEEAPTPAEFEKGIKAAAGFDRQPLIQAALTLTAALSRARDLLLISGDWVQGVTSRTFETSFGLVAVGGPGPDVHVGPALLIVDLGGHDLYRGRVASGLAWDSALVLDLAGNDTYLGENCTQGSGFLGIGILMDEAGDDRYLAARHAQGAGTLGVGLLLDGGGDDQYLAESFAQAASDLGWGGLLDRAGNDTFQCDLRCQAFSGVLGVSSLTELGGNDYYLAGRQAPDPREPEMHRSFAQGFATGLREAAPGGLALLADREGDDVYRCQYFGQGTGYWMGIGILYDQTGRDLYSARRYAQGAGIHYALGLLLDAAGDDQTLSWGVSQGCGHDLGAGILVNERGNDLYVADWLSMGAAEAGGVGLFVDNSGDDRYQHRAGMAAGQFVDETGGLGLFLDAGGSDRYASGETDGAVWGSSRWSLGLDREAHGLSGLNLLPPPDRPGPGEEVVRRRNREKLALERRLAAVEGLPAAARVETLLAVSAHWGFETEVPERAGDLLLALDPAQSLPAALKLLGSPRVAILRSLDTLFGRHAFLAAPRLVEKAADPSPLVRSRAFHFLGRLAVPQAIEPARQALKDPSWQVRSAAVEALGRMLASTRFENGGAILADLRDRLKDRDPAVRSAAARAVGRLRDQEAVPELLTLLGDPDFRVHDAAARALVGFGDEVAARLTLLLEHAPMALRIRALFLLGRFQSEASRALLAARLEDPDPMIRRAARAALSGTGPYVLK